MDINVKENEPRTMRQKCDVRKCRTYVVVPKIFCEACWKKLLPETRRKLVDAWPATNPGFLDALNEARKELAS